MENLAQTTFRFSPISFRAPQLEYFVSDQGDQIGPNFAIWTTYSRPRKNCGNITFDVDVLDFQFEL